MYDVQKRGKNENENNNKFLFVS